MSTAPTATDTLAGPRFSQVTTNRSTGIQTKRFYVDSTLRLNHDAHSHVTESWADRFSRVYTFKQTAPLGPITDPAILADIKALYCYWGKRPMPTAWSLSDPYGKGNRVIERHYANGKAFGWRFAGCLENYSTVLLQVLKDSIKPQLTDFKRQAFAGGSQILCENACGTWLNQSNTEVDHIYPLALLQRRWIRRVDFVEGRERYEIRKPSLSHEDPKVAYDVAGFAVEHQASTAINLRLLCINCNQTLGKQLAAKLAAMGPAYNWI